MTLAVAGVVIPNAAGAKVTCDAGNPVTPLPGLPPKLEPGHTYALTVDLPRAHAANPRPLLLAQRCARGPGGLPPDADDFGEFPGTHEGAAGATFSVRFPRAGRWHVVSMDVSGHFRDHGFYAVQTGPTSTPAASETRPWPIVIGAGAIIVSAPLLFVVLRRRRHSATRTDA
jgi:hypothetical protein